jgi:hypothetical protein
VIIVSECWQRLGTLMSAVSSLYAMEMDTGTKMFLHRAQEQMLQYYFDIKKPFRILDEKNIKYVIHTVCTYVYRYTMYSSQQCIM